MRWLLVAVLTACGGSTVSEPSEDAGTCPGPTSADDAMVCERLPDGPVRSGDCSCGFVAEYGTWHACCR